MAKKGAFGSAIVLDNPAKKRPGVHAKSKTSKLKSSKNYRKKYRGQGR